MGVDRTSQTSGDLLADRRYAYATDMLASGDNAAAADLLLQIIERVPDWIPAWMALGAAEERLGKLVQATEAYRRAADLDQSGLYGATLHVGRLNSGQDLAGMPEAYVTALFDDYAPRFDRHLQGELGYSAPTLLAEILAPLRDEDGFGDALDLGCGTGLVGVAIWTMVEAIDGVDLSPAMLEGAATTGVYRALAADDIGRHLAGLPSACYDLVVAADVFVYVGDLDVVFEEVARVLLRGGVLAFTVQDSGGEPLTLGPDLRFSHSAAALGDGLARAGLDLLEIQQRSTRRERGADVPGLVVVARHP